MRNIGVCSNQVADAVTISDMSRESSLNLERYLIN